MSNEKGLQKFTATFGLEDACAFLMLDMKHDVVIEHGVSTVMIPNQQIAECLTDGGVGFSQWYSQIGKDTRLEGTLVRISESSLRWVVKLLRANNSCRYPEGIASGELNIQDLASCKTKVNAVGFDRLLMKAFPYDDLKAGHYDRDWNEGTLYMYLDHLNPTVRAHRNPRIIIPHKMIASCLNGKVGESVKWDRELGGTKIVGKLRLTSDSTVLLTIKLTGAVPDSGAPEGMVIVHLPVGKLYYYQDIQEVCLPLAGRAYRTVRDAFYRGGGGWESTMVHDAVDNRLRQTRVFTNCKHEGLRNKYAELIAVMDLFFEDAENAGSAQKAIDIIDHFIAGGVSLSEELAAKHETENLRVADERSRKQNSIATVEDVQMERERQRLRREAQREIAKSKRAKRNVAGAPKTSDDDAETVDSDQVLEESSETESGENGGRETEGHSEVATTTDEAASLPRTAVAERLFQMLDGVTMVPATEAAKQTEPDVEAPKLSFRDQLLLRKAQMATDDSAPAEAAAATVTAQSE